MVDEVALAMPTANPEPKKRFSFSLRLLMVVMTLAAVGAALAASYPFIAGLLAFALILELVPLGLQAAATTRARELLSNDYWHFHLLRPWMCHLGVSARYGACHSRRFARVIFSFHGLAFWH